jgi:hypothetical protein
MKFAVVDLQAFQFKDGRVMVKELCIYDGKDMSNFLIIPTTNYKDLTKEDRKVVNYLTFHHHGLQFQGGFVNAGDIPNILSYHLKDVDRIYVKGDIKYKFLINNLKEGQVVINLEYHISPKLLPGTPCKYHLNVKKPVICASNNARLIYNYLIKMLPY